MLIIVESTIELRFLKTTLFYLGSRILLHIVFVKFKSEQDSSRSSNFIEESINVYEGPQSSHLFLHKNLLFYDKKEAVRLQKEFKCSTE